MERVNILLLDLIQQMYRRRQRLYAGVGKRLRIVLYSKEVEWTIEIFHENI